MARVRAPELAGSGGWINATAPLSLGALLGKIVILDFWTSSSINCIRVLEELRPIEEGYGDEVVVVGIHSPKFGHEQDHASVERAAARLRITHPVLDDPELATWRQYGVRGWPTLVVVDPEGYLVGGISGEGCGPVLTKRIEELVTTHEANGTLVRGWVAGVTRLAPAVPQHPLSFPGKVTSSPDGRLLAIADTGHDRVLVCDLEGRVERVIGNLHQPQGVCFDLNGAHLLVCDTGTDRVLSVPSASEEDSPEVIASGIASPWDIVVDADGSAIVAEAGRHRLWRVTPDGATDVLAGAGEGGLVDAAAPSALLAQPSGLARLMAFGNVLAFLDADASALRAVNLDGNVVTLVGSGLFEWGANDGGCDVAALQHPLGLAASPSGVLFIADTFNSSVRRWDAGGEAGEQPTGEAGRLDAAGGAAGLSADRGSLSTVIAQGLDEPGGLDLLADGRLVVADTNNHRIVVIDVASGVLEPLTIDESWLGTSRAGTITVKPQEVFPVPFEIDLATGILDRSDGEPVRVNVYAVPPTLLGPGPRAWALGVTEGTLELEAGEPGAGIVVTEVAVSVFDDSGSTVIRTRARHDLTVLEDGTAKP